MFNSEGAEQRDTGAVGILLAAGAGRRFGMPKVLAAEGEWLRSAVSALAGGGCGQVIVVLGAAVVDVPAPARAVIAPDWADGMGCSLRAGLAAAGGSDAGMAVVHLVDLPDVGPDVVGRVLDAADREAKLALLNAHPDLAGKLALARQLTAARR